jgi:diketogulonate reductase-like aldo/keto reductase
MHNVTANGANIPALGFGTWQLAPEDAEAMVEHALKTGYRHIDTAQMYDNEEAVGRGIQKSGVARENIFLTTKVWTDQFADGDLQKSVRASLERLGTDYLDLLLLHWPNPDIPLAETMGALDDTQDQGLTRNIGISNFTAGLIREAVEHSNKPLATNQVEYHPYLNQKPVRDTLTQHGMALTAYCPLARGEVFNDATLTRIGKSHGKNAGQVALRWLIQQDNVIALPRSSKPEHVASNFAIFDFELSPDDMDEISKMYSENGRMINPSFAPDWDNAA